MAYYKYMAEGQRPSVAVIEDYDFPNCVGAFWGEINTTVHKGFGVSGVVTNGVVRDGVRLPGTNCHGPPSSEGAPQLPVAMVLEVQQRHPQLAPAIAVL